VLYEQGGLGVVEKHYAQLSARVGYDVPVTERSLTFILNSLASRSRFSEGEPIVKKALDMYPQSSDVHFTLGRFFSAMKDEQRAIAHLTRLLELSPDNMTARRMLANLKVDTAKISPPVEVPATTLASYHGRYRAAGAELRIMEENGRLYAVNALARHQLQPMSMTRFYCVDGDKQFTFRLGNNNRVTALIVHQAGKDFEMARLK
jgi:tetratricopeptide (TPR) repeat protein